MLLQAAETGRIYGLEIQNFLEIIIKFLILAIPIILIFLLVKKVIKPIMGYFKTKQEYYQAQTEAIKNEKDRF